MVENKLFPIFGFLTPNAFFKNRPLAKAPKCQEFQPSRPRPEKVCKRKERSFQTRTFFDIFRFFGRTEQFQEIRG